LDIAVEVKIQVPSLRISKQNIFVRNKKYDQEKIFEQYYSLEKSAINFLGKIEVTYNFEKFSKL